MTTQISDADDGLEAASLIFARVRGRLFGIAHRILGSADDAEDVVQEAWIRWQTYDRATVRAPEAFLAVTTTRLALNCVQCARARHEQTGYPSIPVAADAPDPAAATELGEALESALQLLLERLTPTERAAYVLRHAFDYPYAVIADLLHTTQVAVRQLVSRAGKHLAAEKRSAVDRSTHERLLSAFVVAASTGDLDGLEKLLAAGVVRHDDAASVSHVTAAHVARRPGSRRPAIVPRHPLANGPRTTVTAVTNRPPSRS